MLLDLTGLELATAAQACRALAFQEGEREKRWALDDAIPAVCAARRR